VPEPVIGRATATGCEEGAAAIASPVGVGA